MSRQTLLEHDFNERVAQRAAVVKTVTDCPIGFTFNEYQKATAATAVYPPNVPDALAGVLYCGLGLAGEVGEIANKIKKLVRDGDSPEKRAVIRHECGDAMWYLSQLLKELDGTMEDAARENIEKLAGRKERGTIHGSGDVR